MKPGLRCIACGRALQAFTVSVPGRDGAYGWGPKCAKAVIVAVKPTRTLRPVYTVARVPMAAHVDPNQMALELA